MRGSWTIVSASFMVIWVVGGRLFCWVSSSVCSSVLSLKSVCFLWVARARVEWSSCDIVRVRLAAYSLWMSGVR